ncbi:MAG: hypothetical protein LBT35_07040 [Tannerella sp.]|jgi:hypothetical protein|nr:hypothetical protein [Tannerella sp.]
MKLQENSGRSATPLEAVGKNELRGLAVIMLKRIYLTVLLFAYGSGAYGQSFLEHRMERVNATVNMPSYFEVSNNKDIISVTEIDLNDSLDINRVYRGQRAYGPNAFVFLFGHVVSILRHESKEYVVFVETMIGRGDAAHGDIKTHDTKIYTLNEVLPFSRIKHDFNFGTTFRSDTFEEVYALDLMLTHYPKERAKELFNAEAMVMYPFDLEGNVYEDKYAVCRAVVAEKDGLSFFLYYMMTIDNFRNFDKFLDDMKGVFRFKDTDK